MQLSVVSEDGKEATLGILGEGDFFGEGGLAGQLLRMSSATAMTDCVLLHIERKAMMLAMSLEPKLSAMFVKYLLKRNIRYQDDLVDQLFNSSEKRLARVLLLMAQFGKEGVSEMSVPRLSQETLAEMVGTTRSRVSFFMNRFRKLGFINYDVGDNLHVHSSLLNVVLHDDDGISVTPERENPTAPARKVQNRLQGAADPLTKIVPKGHPSPASHNARIEPVGSSLTSGGSLRRPSQNNTCLCEIGWFAAAPRLSEATSETSAPGSPSLERTAVPQTARQAIETRVITRPPRPSVL